MERNIERRSLRINSSEEAANEPSQVVLYDTEAVSGEKPFQFDREDRSVVVNGIRKSLVPTEYRLLTALMDGQGSVKSKEDLRSQLPEPGKPQASDESLRFWLYRLRKKVESDPKQPRLIKSVKGIGYRFNMMSSDEDRTEEVYQLDNRRNYYPERNTIEVDGQENSFTKTENALFWLFVNNIRKVMLREELIDKVRSMIDKDIGSVNKLKKYIHRLRRKTKDEKIEGEDQFFLIRTVHGKGYMLFVYPAQRNPQNTH